MSDLHSDARQLSVYLMPNFPLSAGLITLGYAYTDSRAQTRGFDYSTARDPREMEWSPSSFAPKHTIVTQFTKSLFDFNVTMTGMLRATSGTRYTPVVSGDVNGDGFGNDRAFIFDPTLTSAPSGLAGLFAHAPKRVRDCLNGQVGRLAAMNSCDGPWTATLNGNFAINTLPKFGDRARLFINFANVTGGIDQLLHGTEHLRGWGTQALSDPVLLQVRGFDPATESFSYTANPRFGSASVASALLRNPFRVTIDLQLTLGRTTGEQAVEQNMRIRPSFVGTRASADTIRARYLATAGTDIYALMLRLSDSIALSREQMETLRKRQQVLRERADSIYTILAGHLAALPSKFDTKKAAQEVFDTRESLWVVIRAERDFIQGVLGPGQIRLLPSSLQRMIADKNDRTLFFSAAFTPLPRRPTP